MLSNMLRQLNADELRDVLATMAIISKDVRDATPNAVLQVMKVTSPVARNVDQREAGKHDLIKRGSSGERLLGEPERRLSEELLSGEQRTSGDMSIEQASPSDSELRQVTACPAP